jgi:hypothetical protein
LNTITRRGEIGTEVPVFGLRRDTLTFLEIFRHGSISLPFQNPDYREMRIAA